MKSLISALLNKNQKKRLTLEGVRTSIRSATHTRIEARPYSLPAVIRASIRAGWEKKSQSTLRFAASVAVILPDVTASTPMENGVGFLTTHPAAVLPPDSNASTFVNDGISRNDSPCKTVLPAFFVLYGRTLCRKRLVPASKRATSTVAADTKNMRPFDLVGFLRIPSSTKRGERKRAGVLRVRVGGYG